MNQAITTDRDRRAARVRQLHGPVGAPESLFHRLHEVGEVRDEKEFEGTELVLLARRILIERSAQESK